MGGRRGRTAREPFPVSSLFRPADGRDLAQLVLLNIPARGARHLVDDLKALRPVLLGELLRLEMARTRLEVEGLARAQSDEGATIAAGGGDCCEFMA